LDWTLTAVSVFHDFKTIHREFYHFPTLGSFPSLKNATVKYNDFAGCLATLHSEHQLFTIDCIH